MIYGLIHATGVATFGYAVYYEFWMLKFTGVRTPALVAMAKFPGKWKYLTVWNLVLQFAYHTYSLCNDVAGSNELCKKQQTLMQKIRDGLFAAWIFPLGTLVSVAFWSLYAYDPKLMFPPVIEKIIPNWLNHVQHTAPIAFVTINMLMIPKTYPQRRTGATVALLGASTYLSWVVWVANSTGVYPYPILEVLNNVQRGAFLGSMAGVLLGFYFVGEKIQSWRWGESKEDTKTSSISEKSKSKRKIK